MPLHNKGVVVMFNAKGSGVEISTVVDTVQPFASERTTPLDPAHKESAFIPISPLSQAYVTGKVPPLDITNPSPSQLSGQETGDNSIRVVTFIIKGSLIIKLSEHCW